jgi:hypothetical protein
MLSAASDGSVSIVAALKVVSALTAQDAAHGHLADNLVLAENNMLSAATAGSASVAATLTVVSALTAHDAAHGHFIENISIQQLHLISIVDSLHIQMVNDISLHENEILLPNDALHLLTSSDLNLESLVAISIENTNHILTSEGTILVENKSLSTEATKHLLISDNAILSANTLLNTQESELKLFSDVVTLIQLHLLYLYGGKHGHSASSFDILNNPDRPTGRLSGIPITGVVKNNQFESHISTNPKALIANNKITARVEVKRFESELGKGIKGHENNIPLRGIIKESGFDKRHKRAVENEKISGELLNEVVTVNIN